MRRDFSQPGGLKIGGTAVIVGSLCLALWVSALEAGAGSGGLAVSRASAAKSAAAAAAVRAPDILSLYPVGLVRGAGTTIEVRGRHFEGAYAVWFDGRGIEARLEKVQLDEAAALVPQTKTGKVEKEDQSPRQIAFLTARLTPQVVTGKHSLRLIGPGGISKALPFLVYSDRGIAETGADHGSPQSAQPISIPLLLEGKLAKMGEVDYYSLDAAAGQELVFSGVSNSPTKSGNFDGLQFTLYAAGSSWFDPHRPTRVAFSDEPRLTYRFPKAGRYLLALSGYLGAGGPDFSYQLRIHPGPETHAEKLNDSIIDDLDQTFARQLGPDRISRLWARTVFPEVPRQAEKQTAGAGAGSVSPPGAAGHATEGSSASPREASAACTVYHDREPNETSAQSQELTLPAVVDGAIQRPGDVDTFRFKVKSGEPLAIELETPAASLPEFNPRITVSDSKGQEVLTNIWRRVGGDNNQWMKTLQPKAIYTVEKDDEYTLQIGDLVSYLYGGKTFRYRMVIRPQVPHVGKIEIKQEEINVVAGQAAKLNLTVEQEEGYTGDIALSVENLPPGLQALPAAEVEPDPVPKLDEGPKERFVSRKRELAILLLAGAHAPPTRLPYLARVSARAVVGKQVGSRLPVQEIPVMVIRPQMASANASRAENNNRSKR
jgi:hypothetical protein